MSPGQHPPATDEPPVQPTLLDDRSRLAWTEPMAVKPFGGAYVVDCESDGTHFVRLGEGGCSCDDDAPDDRCKHVRRVAIEINLGRIPPPDERTVACRGCGDPVAVSVADDPPHLCLACSLAPGDVVVDVEGDPNTPLLVVSHPERAADSVSIPGEDCTVAEYPGNDDYSPDAPVVEVVYPLSVTTDRRPRRYLFPVARLVEPEGVVGGDRVRREPLSDGWPASPD